MVMERRNDEYIYMVEYWCAKAKAGGPMRGGGGGDGLTKEHCIIECKPIYKE